MVVAGRAVEVAVALAGRRVEATTRRTARLAAFAVAGPGVQDAGRKAADQRMTVTSARGRVPDGGRGARDRVLALALAVVRVPHLRPHAQLGGGAALALAGVRVPDLPPVAGPDDAAAAAAGGRVPGASERAEGDVGALALASVAVKAEAWPAVDLPAPALAGLAVKNPRVVTGETDAKAAAAVVVPGVRAGAERAGRAAATASVGVPSLAARAGP